MFRGKQLSTFLFIGLSSSVMTNIYLFNHFPRDIQQQAHLTAESKENCNTAELLITEPQTLQKTNTQEINKQEKSNQTTLPLSSLPTIAEAKSSTEEALTPFNSDLDKHSHTTPLEIESMELSYERHQTHESFYSLNSNEQNNVIKTLVDSDDDLNLINTLLSNTHDTHVQRTAIERLASFNSFASTHLLIKNLENTSDEIKRATVDALVSKGDRSVVPYLQEIQFQQSDITLEEHINKAVNTLYYSTQMGSDGLGAVHSH